MVTVKAKETIEDNLGDSQENIQLEIVPENRKKNVLPALIPPKVPAPNHVSSVVPIRKSSLEDMDDTMHLIKGKGILASKKDLSISPDGKFFGRYSFFLVSCQ